MYSIRNTAVPNRGDRADAALVQPVAIDTDIASSILTFTALSLIGTNLDQLSAFDAAYLLLAERDGIPLATCDEALHAGARDAGVSLLACS